MKRSRLKLGKHGDVLWVTVTPRYVHLHLTQPGKYHYTHDIYIPRRGLLTLLPWLVKSLKAIPREGSFYPPDKEREYLAREIAIEDELKQLKRLRNGPRRRSKRRRV